MNPLESLVRSYAEADPPSVARQLEGLDPAGAGKILDRLSVQGALRVLESLNAAAGARIFETLEPARAAALLGRTTPRIAAAILQPMAPEKRESILGFLGESGAQPLRQQMLYAPDTAAGMMTPQVASFSVDLTVQEVISAIRKTPRETIYYLYVTDREGKLLGVLNSRELLLADPKDRVEGLVSRSVVSVPAHTDREQVAELMSQKGFMAVPVVDSAGRLLGVVKQERIVEAVREEAFEDLQKMVGAGGDERALSPVPTLVRKRLPWLSINLGTAFMAAIVVGFFQGLIKEITALAVLMPVVSAVSGNTGVQALAVVMRGLALREIGPGNRLKVLLKEAAGGFLNGLLVALLCGLVVYFWFGLPSLALVIAGAMVTNMVAAGVLGAAIPLVLRALGRDPAQSSSIFLTTMTDVVGFGSFLGLAALFRQYLH